MLKVTWLIITLTGMYKFLLRLLYLCYCLKPQANYVYTGLLAPQTSYGESHATEVEIEASARDAAIRCIHQCLGVCGPSCSNPRELAECCHRHHTEVKYICSEYLVYVSNGCIFCYSFSKNKTPSLMIFCRILKSQTKCKYFKLFAQGH